MKKSYSKHKSGYTVVEIAFVIALGSIFVVISLMGFTKLYAPSVANSEYNKSLQVIGAAERAAQDNGGAFPTAGGGSSIATATPGVGAGIILDQMGDHADDLGGWTYGCATPSVTITTTALFSTSIASMLAKKITSSSPNWSAAAAGNVVTMTKTGITCN